MRSRIYKHTRLVTIIALLAIWLPFLIMQKNTANAAACQVWCGISINEIPSETGNFWYSGENSISVDKENNMILIHSPVLFSGDQAITGYILIYEETNQTQSNPQIKTGEISGVDSKTFTISIDIAKDLAADTDYQAQIIPIFEGKKWSYSELFSFSSIPCNNVTDCSENTTILKKRIVVSKAVGH